MKKTLYAFLLCSLGLAGCQTKTSTETATSGTETTPATTPGSSMRPSPEATVLQQDTLNAVQDETVKKPATGNATSDFGVFFRNFEKTIQQEDAQAFNQYIDPARGLYIIDTPGAMPQFTHVQDIRQYKRFYQNLPFFTIKEYFKSCDLQPIATLPKVTCEGEDAYAQKGCFVADAVAFRKNTAVQYTELPAAQKKTIALTQLLVTKTVLHTASGFKFHFAQIEGQWRVLFIDLMIPCSA
ncbi:hypothetical protein GU926_09305 [Nibribacter ruber]|uniref:Uncharacterized protein n=1 Tax=Nibribacter ruber TaxID=2698458 RepID=A0A6P1NYW9_9BACT|nr:hypothetical protein [Nibribacter ruber]QHL87624.1 hypothetical protein GU926_09305 [Nibribacter ruber]